MPYCLKCGTKVEDEMTFCPACGAPLKDNAQTIQATNQPENSNPQPQSEANQPSKSEVAPNPKMVKTDFSFLKYLVPGLILVTLGASSILEITSPRIGTGEFYAMILIIIALIIILSSVYYIIAWQKHSALRSSKKSADTHAEPAQ